MQFLKQRFDLCHSLFVCHGFRHRLGLESRIINSLNASLFRFTFNSLSKRLLYGFCGKRCNLRLHVLKATTSKELGTIAKIYTGHLRITIVIKTITLNIANQVNSINDKVNSSFIALGVKLDIFFTRFVVFHLALFGVRNKDNTISGVQQLIPFVKPLVFIFLPKTIATITIVQTSNALHTTNVLFTPLDSHIQRINNQS